MKSFQVNSAQSPLLVEKDIPRPAPQKGEILIRVHAAGVTPTELVWYPTLHTKTGEKRIGAVPSHEFSGEIAEIGEGVPGISIGDEVYGMNDWFADGALAEYCITSVEWIAPKPKSLSHAEAASVPIGALTAWQGLFERTQLQPGERVLVHGGAGAVGVYAVQMARALGTHVITTVSPRNFEFVQKLGADEVIDYRSVPFDSVVSDIDVVFDGVGGDTLHRSWNVLKPNGRLVTIAADSEDTSDERTKRAFFIVEPNRQQLIEIGNRLDSGKLSAVVDTVIPFSEASIGYEGKAATKGRGKVVIELV